jgi:carbonic anhydrase
MEGIIRFREKLLPKYAQHFRRLASHQSPETLFISCSDSRVVPSLLTSTHPGDLFTVRNVGNLVPPASTNGISTGDLSEASAIEYAVLILKVSEIIVCGHSECGAMKAICAHDAHPDAPNLSKWLRHARPAAQRMEPDGRLDAGLKPHDRLSQMNVLVQLEHLTSYPPVRERIGAGALRLHGWWFDVASGSMYAYDSEQQRFDLIDRRMVRQMVARRSARIRENSYPARDGALY